MPTVATASAPSLDTQNTSTIANTDSISISRIIGTASKRMARPSEPSVKSCLEPPIASRTESQKLGVRRSSADEVGSDIVGAGFLH